MLCYLRVLLFKNSWYHYVILQRWGYHSHWRSQCHPPQPLAKPVPPTVMLLSTLRRVVRHSVAAELVVGPERAVQVGPALDATLVISG